MKKYLVFFLISLVYLSLFSSTCLAQGDSTPSFISSPTANATSSNTTVVSAVANQQTPIFISSPPNESASGTTNPLILGNSQPSKEGELNAIQKSDCLNCEEKPYTTFAVMNFTPEQVAQGAKEFEKLPLAHMDTEISARLEGVEPALPTQYDVLNYLVYVPKERNQGGCGNCWVWPSIGMLEIDLARTYGIKERQSVQWFSSTWHTGGCTPDANPSNPAGGFDCCGGWPDWVARWYTSTINTQAWSNTNAQFRDDSRSCGKCSDNCPTCPNCKSTTATDSGTVSGPQHYVNSVTDTQISTLGDPNAADNIKNVLMQGKGVAMTFFLPQGADWSDFGSHWSSDDEDVPYSFDYANGQAWDANGAGHVVLIVGWNGPNWICLNSWSNNPNKPNGIFAVPVSMNYNLQDSTGVRLLYFDTYNVNWGTKIAPTTPTKLSSTGTLPVFEWDKQRDASWYGIWIDGPSGHVFDKWYTATEVGASINPTCSVTPGVTLNPNTRYTWWIQPWGPGGYGSWSSPQTYWSGATPSEATLISPAGTSQHTKTPRYEWKRVPSSTWYYLWINNPAGGKVLDQWYTADEVTKGSICAITPKVTLPSGTCTWWIQTWNEAGFGPWSSSQTFVVP